MKKYSLLVHGGAGKDSDFIKKNRQEIESGMRSAMETGLKILRDGGTALTAVENAIRNLEDNPLFNSGRGSALNNKGEIEMDASIMCGRKRVSGAVSMVKNVRNPISLARYIMDNTSQVFLSSKGALEFAKHENVELEPESYFVTDHQVEAFIKARDHEKLQDVLRKRIHGTVGAVAMDSNGNLAAGTSTGGTENSLAGRIGDSSIIGAGCYAQNGVCAVSGTGDGEILINRTIASSVAMAVDYLKMDMQTACDWVINERNADISGDVGLIGVGADGAIGMSFNSERMHRAWLDASGEIRVAIY